ncbi:hypothetical protein DQ04_00401150 [Trypanosoma grayi]|uniref:hypothetical protein n=1 Tax=Trypanosoma grayi TaxID=71804 RepID=UPI0004F4A360|nr:hypothetical protein DQ04_00401150 [Trypanosoma grayi]KEG14575.1 hypothetical protein DQ04_00401150 [Trypanosoma grayi]
MCGALSDVAEFDFVDAPNIITSDTEGDAVVTYSWSAKMGIDEAKYAAGDAVVRRCMTSRDNSYDIVLGFSQGALAAARYVMLQQLRSDEAYGPPLGGLIMAAAPDARRAFPELASAYQRSVERGADESGFFGTLPSLHIVGRKDAIVDPMESTSFAELCQPHAEVALHEHAHSIPQLQSIIGAVRSFLERVARAKREQGREEEEEEGEGDGAALAAAREEELEMISSMYDEGYVQRGPTPVVLLPLLLDCSAEDALDGPLSVLRLRLTLPRRYPAELPKVDVLGGPTSRHVRFERWKAELLIKIMTYLQEDLGVGNAMLLPTMMFASEQASCDLEFLRSVFHDEAHTYTGGNNNNDDYDQEAQQQQQTAWWDAEETESERRAYIVEAERCAQGLLAEKLPLQTPSGDHSAEGDGSGNLSARGGTLELTIGLIGKPSAGKSTFFNAVTDPESESKAAKVAAFPFTTIEPNVGAGFGAVFCPCCIEPPLLSSSCDATYGHVSINGTPQRRHPVIVKDVAGLVQGAYMGKGKGNQFLNDLCDANVLVHVVDGAGATDAEGSACAPGTGSTCDDITWVRAEVHSWIYDNLRSKWDSICRKPAKLRVMFTGYRSPPSFVDGVLRRVGITNDTELTYRVPAWGATELHLLVGLYVRMRFPIVVALNKADMRPAAGEILSELQRRYPHEIFVPMSAKMECNLLQLRHKGFVRYISGDCSFETVEINSNNASCNGTALGPAESKALAELRQFFGNAPADSNTPRTTGVQEVLAAALSHCPAFLVFPVATLKLPLPSLKECFVFKLGTTAGEVFASLLHAELLDGKLVRFEAVAAERLRTGHEATPLKKDATLPGRNVVVRVLTNKRQMAF